MERIFLILSFPLFSWFFRRLIFLMHLVSVCCFETNAALCSKALFVSSFEHWRVQWPCDGSSAMWSPSKDDSLSTSTGEFYGSASSNFFYEYLILLSRPITNWLLLYLFCPFCYFLNSNFHLVWYIVQSPAFTASFFPHEGCKVQLDM